MLTLTATGKKPTKIHYNYNSNCNWKAVARITLKVTLKMFLHFIWSSRVGQCVDIPLVGLCSYDCLISRAVYRILWRENIERCTHANTSSLHLRHLSTSYFKMNLLLFSATSVTCCVCQSILASYSSILALYATRVALNKYMWLVTSAAWAENDCFYTLWFCNHSEKRFSSKC